MARKRMISPEIWESATFSSLSDLAKIVFISLVSHADDEGRGIAKASYITNITFPYDENRRVADIKKALSEIALCMSTQFYSVNGIEYYVMTNWKRWQKIDKPSKSKLPPPPTVGVGGELQIRGTIDEDSAKSSRIINEDSEIKVNRIEVNRITNNNCACAREEVENPLLRDFLKEFPNVVIDTSNVYGVDFELLREKFLQSMNYLSNTDNPVSLSWIVKNYHLIIRNKYKDGINSGGHQVRKDVVSNGEPTEEEKRANAEWFDSRFGGST